MSNQQFKREERLKSRKAIERLFQKGKSFGQYPLRIIYAPKEKRQGEAPVQFTVSVPKRKFPKAADRNRIRRQVKECWRLNKHRLYTKMEKEGPQFAVMVLYTAHEPLPYHQIEGAIKGIIHRFAKKIKKERIQK